MHKPIPPMPSQFDTLEDYEDARAEYYIKLETYNEWCDYDYDRKRDAEAERYFNEEASDERK